MGSCDIIGAHCHHSVAHCHHYGPCGTVRHSTHGWWPVAAHVLGTAADGANTNSSALCTYAGNAGTVSCRAEILMLHVKLQQAFLAAAQGYVKLLTHSYCCLLLVFMTCQRLQPNSAAKQCSKDCTQLYHTLMLLTYDFRAHPSSPEDIYHNPHMHIQSVGSKK